MNIANFYQSSPKEAHPLYLTTQKQWAEGLVNIPEEEHHLFNLQQFTGKLGDICLIMNADGVLTKVYVGSGDENDALALAYAATRLPAGLYEPQQELSQLALSYWALAQYQFTEYKQPAEVVIRCLLISEEALEAVKNQVEAIFLIRDLINRPANDLGPKELALVAEELAKQYNATFEQWVDEELLTNNFPAIYAVGKASANKPRLLALSWGNVSHPRISLIGKGVCFDSGGLDIKPSIGMRNMKKDMGGAAHVLGLAQWIMACQLPVYLQVLIPAVENSIGPQAFRPGDILTMRNQLTVEVDNTDAEGRLILADALVKAGEFNPEMIIDFATLTGAARVAVGTEIAAMFTNDDNLASELIMASKEVNDPIWQLPLFDNYSSMLDSGVADLSNCGNTPYAGAITAALFLKRFVPPTASWVHFDIMAWNVSSKPGKPEGGEAMAIRAVAHYLQKTYGSMTK
ncbi:aminopeptidase [Legionella beliardensis]|uniref:Aminopeptidase n=1 Tax=Legionella beliardensis TaxID=91822 RepID=A0A378I414_9GAMM|nr:leucyl aminopeptidase family protein [Legionella beliardensis]STX29455.1 aminopeptidase [Legionella beliardensis]